MIFFKPFILSLTLIFTSLIYTQEVQMGFGSISDNGAEITMESPVDVGGFQFDVIGSNCNGASGGLAAYAGFTVSTGGETVLGFSFSGSPTLSNFIFLLSLLFLDVYI